MIDSLSDHFQTALTMAHALRTLPDDYRQSVDDLLERWTERREDIEAALVAGVAPVVIEALLERDKLTGEKIPDVVQLQRTYGAGLLASIFRGDEPFKAPFPVVAAPKVARVTIAERRAKRRERQGR